MKLLEVSAREVAARARELLENEPEQASRETLVAVLRIFGSLNDSLLVVRAAAGDVDATSHSPKVLQVREDPKSESARGMVAPDPYLKMSVEQGSFEFMHERRGTGRGW